MKVEGITYIRDIFNKLTNDFYQLEELEQKYDVHVSFIDYNTLIASIPNEWKRLIRQRHDANDDDRPHALDAIQNKLKITKYV